MSWHTPGPWRVVSDPPDHEGFVQHRIRATAGPVAEVFYVTKDGAADARLIAAAPDLLDACKAALDPNVSMGLADTMLRRAIAKATGETP